MAAKKAAFVAGAVVPLLEEEMSRVVGEGEEEVVSYSYFVVDSAAADVAHVGCCCYY